MLLRNPTDVWNRRRVHIPALLVENHNIGGGGATRTHTRTVRRERSVRASKWCRLWRAAVARRACVGRHNGRGNDTHNRVSHEVGSERLTSCRSCGTTTWVGPQSQPLIHTHTHTHTRARARARAHAALMTYLCAPSDQSAAKVERHPLGELCRNHAALPRGVIRLLCARMRLTAPVVEGACDFTGLPTSQQRPRQRHAGTDAGE